MAIPAETITALTGFGVALVTEVSTVVMPGTMAIEATRAGIMYGRIRSAYAVKVGVTTAARAGRVVRVVTRGAVFDVGARRLTMLNAPGQS